MESAYPPTDINSIWLYKGELKYFRNGKWNSIGNTINWDEIKNIPNLATVATSGSYNDLKDTPSPYSLPDASTSIRGGVFMATKVSDLAGTEDTVAICNKINSLLSVLRNSGVLKS